MHFVWLTWYICYVSTLKHTYTISLSGKKSSAFLQDETEIRCKQHTYFAQHGYEWYDHVLAIYKNIKSEMCNAAIISCISLFFCIQAFTKMESGGKAATDEKFSADRFFSHVPIYKCEMVIIMLQVQCTDVMDKVQNCIEFFFCRECARLTIIIMYVSNENSINNLPSFHGHLDTIYILFFFCSYWYESCM